MSEIDSTLKLKYFGCGYENPKTISGGLVALNAGAEGKTFSLLACKKADLIARETDATVDTVVTLVDGSAAPSSLSGEDDWQNIFTSIDLTKCPYSSYRIMIRKVVGETTTYDIFVNIMDDVVSGDGYQISSANNGSESVVDLYYDNVDTIASLKADGSTGITDTSGSEPHVVAENKYLPFGSITLSANIGDYFTSTIVISRTYTYGTGSSLPSSEFFTDTVTAFGADEAQTFSEGPAMIEVGGVLELSDSVDVLDDLLLYYDEAYLNEDFLIYGVIKDTSSGDYGPMIGIEMPLVYFNVPFGVTKSMSTVYVGSSAMLASVPFSLFYDYSPSEEPITDFDRLNLSKSKVQFIEDGVDNVEYTGENFDYEYVTEDGSYVYNAPFGTPPPSNPEGFTASGIIIPAAANGFYVLTEYTTNDNVVYKHETEEYYVHWRGGDEYDRHAVLSNSINGPELFFANEYYTIEIGVNLSNYSWFANAEGSFGDLSFEYVPELKEVGQKTLSIILYDEYGNRTSPTEPLVVVLSISPADFAGLYLKLIGSSGSSDYTGFYLKDGRYFPTDFVTMLFYGESSLPVQYKIIGDVLCDDSYYDFSGTDIKRRVVRIEATNANDSLLDVDRNVTVTIEFKDAAGNTTTLSDTIRYISKYHRFPKLNIREDGESYQTEIYRVEGNSTTRINRQRISTSDYRRSWGDLFWPSVHSYPLNDDGEIDIEKAIRISQTTIDPTGVTGPTADELSQYDKLVLLTDADGVDNDVLLTDNEERYSTLWNSGKTYLPMTNAYASSDGTGMTYFIIDNAGYSEFRLEFEYFDFDSTVTKLPRNTLSPYDGDVLVIYDASDPDAVESRMDRYGNESFVLKDSTKLREIYAFTGSYLRDDIQMKNSGLENITKSGNGFVTPSINTTSRICIIPYTDSYGQGSGFKLRAGVRHNYEYINYDMLNALGELWFHESPTASNGYWRGVDTVKSTWQNYTTVATVDYEDGSVSFEERPVFPVLTNCTNYEYLLTDGTNNLPVEFYTLDLIKKYLTYHDDLVDYTDIKISVVPDGVTPDYVSLYAYNDATKEFGKVTGGFTINKDLGLIEFSDDVPVGRLISNYYYHTFYRLTNDGYGDLYYYDSSLVPDNAVTSYKDWTYVDLKLVNEGTNALTQGILKFLTRGYVSGDSTIDRVLNNNRPWDVQIGTDAETVNCTGAYVSTQKSTFSTPSRGVAFASRNSQAIAFGTLLPKGVTFVRVYWCLAADAEGNSYVETTRGRKLYSAELSGRYYTLITE